MTLTITDDLATRLRPVEDQLPQILELGLRELHATGPLNHPDRVEERALLIAVGARSLPRP
jgi:hypothetical protein